MSPDELRRIIRRALAGATLDPQSRYNLTEFERIFAEASLECSKRKSVITGEDAPLTDREAFFQALDDLRDALAARKPSVGEWTSLGTWKENMRKRMKTLEAQVVEINKKLDNQAQTTDFDRALYEWLLDLTKKLQEMPGQPDVAKALRRLIAKDKEWEEKIGARATKKAEDFIRSFVARLGSAPDRGDYYEDGKAKHSYDEDAYDEDDYYFADYPYDDDDDDDE